MQPMFNDMVSLARDLAFAPTLAVAMARRKSNDTGYECAKCGAEMSPAPEDREDCRKCPQCGRDHWWQGDETDYTGVSFNGVDELETREVARCLICGYTCDPDDREVTDDSVCPDCHHVGAPIGPDDRRPDRSEEI